MNDKIQKIYEDYGQLHEEGCELNDEGGSFDGCTCAVKTMVQELIQEVVKMCEAIPIHSEIEAINPSCSCGCRIGEQFIVFSDFASIISELEGIK